MNRRRFLKAAGIGGLFGLSGLGLYWTSSTGGPFGEPASEDTLDLTLEAEYESPTDNTEGLVYDGSDMIISEYDAGDYGDQKMYRTDLNFDVIETWDSPLEGSPPAGPIDIAFDGSHVWAGFGDPDEGVGAWVKDDGNGNVLRRVDWTDVDSGITNGQAISHVEAGVFWLSGYDQGVLYKYDVSSETVVRRVSLPRSVENMTYESESRDGPRIYATSDDGDRIYLIDLDDEAIVKRTTPPGSGDPEGIEIVGSTLYFASGAGGGTGRIYEFSL